MKYLTTFLLGLSFIFASSLTAQNLVPNGSFESYTSLPNSTTDWELCVGWNNVNMNLGSWPYATPDYLHTSGSGDAQLPNCKWADVNPQDGNAIMGLYSNHASQLDARDYISTQLTSPLTVGDTYTISFWLSNGSGNYFYGSSSENFGAQLTTTPFTQVDHENLGGTPQAVVPGEPWNTGWVFYSFTYVATAPHEYITLGNFATDAATNKTTQIPGANYPAGSYYFLDDVRVEPATTLPITLSRFDAKNAGKHVNTDWTTENEVNNDFFTVERSEDGINWNAIGNVKGAGNSETVLHYSYIDIRPLTGVSYYRLMQTDFDGATSYSDVKTVFRSDENNELKIFPNPTEGIVTVYSSSNDISDYQIFNAMGSAITDQVKVISVDGTSKITLDFSQMSPGVYVFRSEEDVKKIVVK